MAFAGGGGINLKIKKTPTSALSPCGVGQNLDSGELRNVIPSEMYAKRVGAAVIRLRFAKLGKAHGGRERVGPRTPWWRSSLSTST